MRGYRSGPPCLTIVILPGRGDQSSISSARSSSTSSELWGTRQRVETDVLAVLEGTVDYEIEADQLTLRNGDAGLVYRAAP